MLRSLFGQCIFSTKTASSTALSEEVYAASLTPQFAANALALQASFNATQLAFETAYFAATAAGDSAFWAVLPCMQLGAMHINSGHSGNWPGAGLSVPYPKLPTWVAPTVYNYTYTIELYGQVQPTSQF